MRVWGGRRRMGAWAAMALMLAGCGGGGGSDGAVADCSIDGQKQWLRSTMNARYYWAGRAPDPAPGGYASVAAYLDGRRDALDRFSYITDATTYQQFFGEGRTLGYGLAVNGVEATLPLKLRLVEPLSPAGRAGLLRGDVVVSIAGRGAADLVAANDFAALTPTAAGDLLNLVLERDGQRRSVTLTAEVYTLTPVPVATVLTLADGRRAGFVVLKDFITQAEEPLAQALADFRAAGATELVVDLRYNGGGRVSTAVRLASLIAGAARAGSVFTELRYNAQQAASSNVTYRFAAGPAPAFGRVVVLTGPRTCSASELLVNGLAPWVDVASVGGTTCGKPYGFNPVERCGSSFSLVNFETVNADGVGGYDNGLAPRCPATDGFDQPFGDPAESLTAAAVGYLDTGACSGIASGTGRAAALSAAPRRRAMDDGGRTLPGLVAD